MVNGSNTSNSILIMFDCLFDVELGVLEAVHDLTKELYDNTFIYGKRINRIIAEQSLSARYYKNPLSIISCNFYGDKYRIDAIYKDFMETEKYKEVLHRSKINSTLLNMIVSYRQQGFNIGIYCTNTYEEDFLHTLFDETVMLIVDSKTINSFYFDSIFCRYSADLERINSELLVQKNIYISDSLLNYNRDTEIFDIVPVLPFISSNEFRTFKFYDNQGVIKCHEYFISYQRCVETNVKICTVRNIEIFKRYRKMFKRTLRWNNATRSND